jgi:transposase
MSFVPIKNIDRQDIQSLHRIRSNLIKARTATVNQIRGLLAEYGIVLPKQIQNIRVHLPAILEDGENELSMLMRKEFQRLYENVVELDKRIADSDKTIKTIFNNDKRCKKIDAIEGVGFLTATAIVAAISDAKLFKNGRELAAWLGLVPKQHSSGGEQRLLGISKRGDKYIRTLLVHGARSVVCRATNKEDPRSLWIKNIRKQRGMNKACVALANKNARIIWAILSKDEAYRKAA